MPANTLPENTSETRPEPTAATVLVGYLRQHPGDVARDPEELAQELGINPAFVRHVLRASRLQEEETDEDAFQIRISLKPVVEWLRDVLNRFDRLIARPVRFLWITLIVADLICMGLAAFAHAIGFSSTGGGLRVSLGSATVVVLATGALHMACYFRQGQVRLVRAGAFGVWVALAAALATGTWRALSGHESSPRLMHLAVMLIGMTMLSLFYAGLGAASAVLGGWLRFHKQDLQDERMSRQDLLERYFELQSRLKSGSFVAHGPARWETSPFVREFRRRPGIWSFALGLQLAFTMVLISGNGVPTPGELPTQQELLEIIAISVGSVMVWLSHIAIGFMSADRRRGLSASLLYSLGGVAATLIPIGAFGPRYYSSADNIVETIVHALLACLVAAVAAMAAEVRTRAAMENSLQRNDPAAVAAEMLRIHWRLSDGATYVCVMVVDAARSSEMKSEADPLAVEYSFREYQEWIERHSAENAGRVHATAGDGAVVTFDSSIGAFATARRLQSDVARFNREVNRLRQPFRLRIGLHRGHVVGEIEEVEFTEVIDIAAHVQGVAPVSGIALSDSIASELSGEDLVPLAKEVDGHKVYLALNPVED